MDETTIESNGRKLVYSTYRDKYNKDSVKLAEYFKDSFDYFYVYFMDGDIRYSITFSEFSLSTGKETVDVCLKKQNHILGTLI